MVQLDLTPFNIVWWIYGIVLVYLMLDFLYYYFGWQEDFIILRVAKSLTNLKFNS